MKKIIMNYKNLAVLIFTFCMSLSAMEPSPQQRQQAVALPYDPSRFIEQRPEYLARLKKELHILRSQYPTNYEALKRMQTNAIREKRIHPDEIHALQDAVEMKDEDYIRFLLRRGANPEPAQQRYPDLVRKYAGADLSDEDEQCEQKSAAQSQQTAIPATQGNWELVDPYSFEDIASSAAQKSPTDESASTQAEGTHSLSYDPSRFIEQRPEYLSKLKKELQILRSQYPKNHETLKRIAINAILEKGIHPNEIHALQDAVDMQDIEYIRFLLQHGANPNASKYPILLDVKKYPIARLLIEYGARVDELNDVYQDKKPFLHHVATSPAFDAELIPLYVNNGVDIAQLDLEGKSALINLILSFAKQEQYHEIAYEKARLLIILGVPLNTRIKSGPFKGMTWETMLDNRILQAEDHILHTKYYDLKQIIKETSEQTKEIKIHASLPAAVLALIMGYLSSEAQFKQSEDL